MPTINFKGKNAVWNHHLSLPYQILEKDKKLSVKGKNEDENLIIEADNLIALKSLLPKYQGKIKCIYIDPPYNTGNENWVYNDRVNSPLLRAWIGEIVGKDDLTKHDKWLCMMVPRLKLLRELLTDDGMIFISIDEIERNYLKCILDEIFGEDNFVSEFSWVRKKKGAFLSKKIRKMIEYVLCYQKKENDVEFFGEKAYLDKWQPIVKRTNIEKELKIIPNTVSTTLGDGIYPKGKFSNGETSVEFLNDFIIEDGIIVNELNIKGRFVWTQEFFDKEIKDGTKISLSKKFGFNVLRADQNEKFKTPSNLINKENGVGTNEDASAELASIFDTEIGKIFSYPKPVSLIKYLISFHTKDNDIILDSFAGSGTTAHAVLELNKEDNGNRKFILVQLPEKIEEDKPAYKAGFKYVHEITRERVKRVIERDKLEVGFSYMRLGPKIDADSILNGDLPTYNEFAKYVYYLAAGKTMDNEESINEKNYFVGKINSETVYLIYEKDTEKLKKLAITLDWAEEVNKKDNGKKIVYAPACFLDEEYLERFNISFVSIPYNLFEKK